LLTALYEKQKRPDLAIEQLTSFLKINEGKPEIALKLANLLQTAGRKAEAQQVLMNTALIDPFNILLHKQLGELLLQGDRQKEAVREFQVLLALNPNDKAGAYYDLSRAYLASGLRSQAKTAVLKALEIAPAFAEAQDLLLKIIGD
jgi:tetratricopeptide (TPR) repeat protein